jgi:hypothetical protein
MATTYLTRTGATPTTSNKYTFSCWVKRGSIGTTETIFRTYSDGSNSAQLIFDSDDTFAFQDIVGGTTVTNLKPSNLFRDTGAWMNFIVQVDYTQATAADRAKIFINGGEVSYSATTVQSQNGASMLNTANNNALGSNRSNSSHYFTGSMSQVNFIDGTAYPATAFGSVNATSGIWVANSGPTVTYGNNGFFLDMANSSDMGNDVSGNANDFTVGGGTVTQMEDTPDNNFATMNPLDNYYSAATFSNGNNTVATAAAPVNWVASTFQVNKGKWYAECKPTAGTGSALVGFAGSTSKNSTQILETAGFFGGNYVNNGEYFFNGSGGAYASSFANGDIISVYLDLDNNFVYFAKNGVLQNSGVPTSGATGTGGKAITAAALTTNGGYAFACGDGNTATRTFDWNFGNGYFGTTAVASAGTNASSNGIFEYDVPTGYTALSTKGLNL